jgi:hypothetical protein
LEYEGILLMPLFDWLFEKTKKPLTQMSAAELRVEERVMARQRDQLVARISKLADDKKKLFEKGAVEKNPEVRRSLAQQFELSTSEQLMVGRELNLRCKELITVSRIRMIAESRERARDSGDLLGRISEKDLLKIQALIEDDAIKAEMYGERLDEVLGVMQAVDQGTAGLSPATQSVLDAWERVDRGTAQVGEAFDEADQNVRSISQSKQAESS